MAQCAKLQGFFQIGYAKPVCSRVGQRLRDLLHTVSVSVGFHHRHDFGCRCLLFYFPEIGFNGVQVDFDPGTPQKRITQTGSLLVIQIIWSLFYRPLMRMSMRNGYFVRVMHSITE